MAVTNHTLVPQSSGDPDDELAFDQETDENGSLPECAVIEAPVNPVPKITVGMVKELSARVEELKKLNTKLRIANRWPAVYTDSISLDLRNANWYHEMKKTENELKQENQKLIKMLEDLNSGRDMEVACVEDAVLEIV